MSPQIAFLALLCSPLAHAASPTPIVERRIWIEEDSTITGFRNSQCGEKSKAWRCLYPVREDCEKALKAILTPCAENAIPDLPEYIDSPETKAAAEKVILACVNAEREKKLVNALKKEKKQDYEECIGAVPRSKPMSLNLQKALDFSKTQTAYTCGDGDYFRKCFTLTASSCHELLDRLAAACALRMEANGTKVKDSEASIQEAGGKITDCTLADLRQAVQGMKKKKTNDKDCE